MIHLHDLTLSDIGRWVVYVHGELGKLKGWNQTVVWVVFKCNNEWDRFYDFTGEPCFPEDLEFWK